MNVLGIDGCKSGWCYYNIDDKVHRFGVASSLEQLLETLSDSKHIFIDMPIGLLDSGQTERLCDIRAREVLSKGRASSVFRVPVREAVYAADYAQASLINYQKTGKKLSKQSWNISAKIRELDTFLRKHPALVDRIYEAHPELCFEGLAGHALEHRKAIREGFNERLQLLTSLEPKTESVIARAWLDHGGYELARDDILDACILALSAYYFSYCRSLPEEPPRDRHGLPMRIVYLEEKPPS
jgi:predicted RNase H-like nuclease